MLAVTSYWCRWCGSRLRGDASAGRRTITGEVSDVAHRSDLGELAAPDAVLHSLRAGEECAIVVEEPDHWWWRVPWPLSGVLGWPLQAVVPDQWFVLAPAGTFAVGESVEVAAVPAVDPTTPAGRDEPRVWRASSLGPDPHPDAGGGDA